MTESRSYALRSPEAYLVRWVKKDRLAGMHLLTLPASMPAVSAFCLRFKLRLPLPAAAETSPVTTRLCCRQIVFDFMPCSHICAGR